MRLIELFLALFLKFNSPHPLPFPLVERCFAPSPLGRGIEGEGRRQPPATLYFPFPACTLWVSGEGWGGVIGGAI
jgi:hypothetical protein